MRRSLAWKHHQSFEKGLQAITQILHNYPRQKFSLFPCPVNSTQRDGEPRQAQHIFHSAMEKAEGGCVIRWCDNADSRAGKVEILVFHTFQELNLATLLTFLEFLN